ncbi:histidine kinase [uncultured Gammaproteobacteria bacterium]
MSAGGEPWKRLEKTHCLVTGLPGRLDWVRTNKNRNKSESFHNLRRLVRISDLNQAQMGALNQELQRRREEAETALQRLQETQESLIQAEKLASLGGLVAGVAHEINTPVGVTLTAASHLADQTETLRRSFADGRIKRSDFETYLDTASEATRLILTNSQRAAELIQGFKQVAVDQTSSERRRFNLLGYVHEILLSLSPKLRQAGHEIIIDILEQIDLDGYPGALSQVLTNLIMNSLQHAFADGQIGRLTIHAQSMDNDIIDLTYSDDGRGVPEEIQPKIFDPFFTTRRGAGGTGLGLHIVFNIVTHTLRGRIMVHSRSGEGTRFLIRFPRLVPESPAGTPY